MSTHTRRSTGAVDFGSSPLPKVVGMQGRGVTSSINVTPMVDVMLVLLIIFMVITPILTAYEAELPMAQHVVPEPDDDVITLGIDARGVYYIAGEPIPADRLPGELRRIYGERPGDHMLFLRADRNVGYDVVLSGIDAARAAGVRTTGAISEPKSQDDGLAAREGAAPGAGVLTNLHERS